MWARCRASPRSPESQYRAGLCGRAMTPAGQKVRLVAARKGSAAVLLPQPSAVGTPSGDPFLPDTASTPLRSPSRHDEAPESLELADRWQTDTTDGPDPFLISHPLYRFAIRWSALLPSQEAPSFARDHDVVGGPQFRSDPRSRARPLGRVSLRRVDQEKTIQVEEHVRVLGLRGECLRRGQQLAVR